MAPSPAGANALRNVTLDDKYELESGRVYLTGVQALVRLLMMQRQRDKLAGLDTAVPEELAALVETLADVLAGLTSADGGDGWLAHQRARLQAGEDATAA